MTEERSTTICEHLWETLENLGVTFVFGLPGTTNLAALEALRLHERLRFVTTRHEQAAGFMADATTRMNARIGVVLVDLGPGLANTANAILAAARDARPMLVVAGNEEVDLIGRDVWHEMPEIETFKALTKFAVRVEHPEAFPRLLRRALQTALSGRPGPVLISIPRDLWAADINATDTRSLLSADFINRIGPDSNLMSEAVALLSVAERPLVLAGGGCRSDQAREALLAFVEQTGLPVVTSPNGRGAISEAHPQCIGHSGRFGQRQASQTLREADLVLAAGSRLDDLTTHNWSLLSKGQKFIQVDTDATMLGRNWPVELAICADASAFFKSFKGLIPDRLTDIWDLAPRAQERQVMRARFLSTSDAESVKPQAVMNALEARVAPDHTITMGGGRFQQFVGEWLVKSPLHFFYAANSGTLGFSLPAAIAVALTHPERQVICCTGDGDFMMNIQELETASRERANLKCVIFNDFAFGAMKARQQVSFATEYSNPSFAELAQIFGGRGRTVRQGSEVTKGIEWLLSTDGLAVLDVLIDREENGSLLFGHDIGDKI